MLGYVEFWRSSSSPAVKLVDWMLERSWVYRAWQAPFVEQKLRPLYRRGEIARARRVLDVGCGPGTNTPHFSHADYIGIDINPDYTASAAHRYGRRFITADVTQYSAAGEGKFDFILANSMMHHLDDQGVRRLLSHLPTLLTDDGFVHVLDLVLPPERLSIAKALALADRGDFPRPFEEWSGLFGESLDVVELEPYELRAAGVNLWHFVYCKGRPTKQSR
jgi:SAM-dependent methyltransferase